MGFEILLSDLIFCSFCFLSVGENVTNQLPAPTIILSWITEIPGPTIMDSTSRIDFNHRQN